MQIADTLLEMIWGTRQKWNINCVDPSTGLPFDITDFDLVMTVKVDPTDLDPGLFQLTNIGDVDNGITKTDMVNGVATAMVLPAATESLRQSEIRAHWDLRLTANGDPTNSQVVAKGLFLIHPAITTQTDV